MDESDTNEPINIVRNETILSRLPIHRLSKKGTLSIQYTKTSDKGKITTIWEVAPNRKYGEAGPLAYKLDTIFINRIIDELRPNIPEVVRLGSLREIAKELECGGSTSAIKKALYQNAFTGITAKLEYRSNDGIERSFEFGATRYDVIFVGQKLPNGHKADAVYIVLHRLYRELLKAAPTRPLDYDYLKELPPAAQRFYELISFQIFGALKNENRRAKYLYSDFCAFAPLTRYFTYDQVKKQMHKIHAPHRASGYLAKVEFVETTDNQGKIDWAMYYTAGSKARAEFRAFTKKKMPLFVNAKGREGAPQTIKKMQPSDNEEDETLIFELQKHSIAAPTARKLAKNHREEAIRQLDVWAYRDQSSIKDPAAWLIKAIHEKYEIPEELQKTKAKAKEVKKETANRKFAEAQDSHLASHCKAFSDYVTGKLREIQKEDPASHNAFDEYFEDKFGRVLRDIPSARLDDLRLTEAIEYFREHQKILNFWEWDKELNPKPFKFDSQK